MPTSATSEWGWNGEERVALFRVRTGPECPESNRWDLLWDSNLNCGIAKEREKINWPEHTAGRSQNKGSEQVQRRAGWLQTGPFPQVSGGRGEGKGANSARETASATTLQTGLQFLTKDFLIFWKSAGRVAAKHKAHAPDWRRRKLEAGTSEGRRCAAPGESAPVKLLAAWAAQAGKAQNAGATESALLWSTRKLEPQAMQGTLHIEQPGAWAAWMGRAHTREQGQTQCGQNTVTPTHTQCYLPATPLPPRSRTELANLNNAGT